MVMECTLCFIVKDGKVLLQKKAKGKFGELKWNGPGGKLDIGETADACVAREVLEETGLKVSDLKSCGMLHFYNKGNKRSPDIVVHVFLAGSFDGEPVDLGEGELRWFGVDELPFGKMWEDDKFWLSHVLAGKNVSGHFYFENNFEKISDYKLEVL